MGKTTKDDYRKNNLKIKKKLTNNTLDVKELTQLFNDECKTIKNIIINSIISIDNKINLNLFSDTDSEIAITCLTGLESKLTNLYNKKTYSIENINELQTVIDDLTTIICGFGTLNVDDLVYICNGKTLKQIIPLAEHQLALEH